MFIALVKKIVKQEKCKDLGRKPDLRAGKNTIRTFYSVYRLTLPLNVM